MSSSPSHQLWPEKKGIFHYTAARQLGVIPSCIPQRLAGDLISRNLPSLLTGKEYNLGKINKVFASEWLSDKQIVFGSKCNKLIVLDLVSRRLTQIPSLNSSSRSVAADCPCGIHSIAVNPSRTLLATGGEHVNDVAVYRLPTFDPVAVGEEGHSDWIFDMKWLDDQFLVSGSRDSKMALWRIEDDQKSELSVSSVTAAGPSSVGLVPYDHVQPMCIKQCTLADRVRALAYSDKRSELAALSLNAYLHFWDATTFTPTLSCKLQFTRENICMSVNKEQLLYAVGCLSRSAIYDPRTPKSPCHVTPRHGHSGTRSVNFYENILSLGTGDGVVHFFDMRAGKFLELACEHECRLQIGHGFLLHDEMYEEYFFDQGYPNAVYTHSWDPSGTKLFTAGGPLPAGLWGNYAALWV